ncbi:MAG: hypothetical protein K9M80_09520 [Candidatus Marinimicrobia bacterium]|nr:hypothetical protein [Candidatus Neomarinimicrobiota bacterium]
MISLEKGKQRGSTTSQTGKYLTSKTTPSALLYNRYPLFHFPKKDLRDRQDSDATSDKTFANRYIVYIFMKKQDFGFG